MLSPQVSFESQPPYLKLHQKRTAEPQNNEPQNVEGMYSIDFIGRIQRMTEAKEDTTYDLEDRLIDY